MNIQDLKQQKSIIFEAISGSKAYGLDTEASDTDIKGVFIMPMADFFSFNYYPQISNQSNDIVYYELKRFFELLIKNNPNTLELLSIPEKHILYKSPLFEQIKPELFLSKLSKETFTGYAMMQIKKARGLHKKILNPIPKKRKNILDFCYVAQGQSTLALTKWLQKNNFDQKKCGLVKLEHMRDMYALFYGDNFQGIMRKEDTNNVKCSSVSKGTDPLAVISFNKDGYQKYCKDYREYWDWVEKRNDARYSNTIAHGKNYDAKNIMHTFRLLEMAEHIAREGKIVIVPKDRDYYLKIRAGDFDYEELVTLAKKKIEQIETSFLKSDLPDKPDRDKIEQLLISLRNDFYGLV